DLWEGAKITSLTALTNYNCLRLSARIANLRAQNVPITMEMVTTKTKKRIAEYHIAKIYRDAKKREKQ
ncbi:hypothetical protein IAI38_11580, partial [Streptococcus pseudopneumoniae]|uniref:helix-turn-helix domain-containing protein n=1 Tax=Streptococcus pseudopneumoniae TaxID=257758 RepID=UPI0018B0ED1E